MDGEPLDPRCFAARELGYGQVVVDRPSFPYRCVVPRGRFWSLVANPIAALVRETREEISNGIVDAEFEWSAGPGQGIDLRRHPDFARRAVLELLDQEFLFSLFADRSPDDPLKAVANSLDDLWFEADGVVVLGTAFRPSPRRAR